MFSWDLFPNASQVVRPISANMTMITTDNQGLFHLKLHSDPPKTSHLQSPHVVFWILDLRFTMVIPGSSKCVSIIAWRGYGLMFLRSHPHTLGRYPGPFKNSSEGISSFVVVWGSLRYLSRVCGQNHQHIMKV